MFTVQCRFIALLIISTPAILTLAVAAENTEQSIEDQKAVVAVLQGYNDALQALTTQGTFELFTDDAQVYEQGGVEGTYRHYVEHHLGPELAHFERFTFSDYSVDVQFLGYAALATQTYKYTIVTKASSEKPSRTIEKKGLATSVLIS